MTLAAAARIHAEADSPVVIVVPYPPGGAGDLFGRAIGPTLSKLLQRPVIVENIPGATGSIGASKVLAAHADGSVLFLGSPTETVLAPISVPSARYRPEDFRLLGLVSTAPLAVYARLGLPPNSLDELVAFAHQSPGKPLSYGSTGVGSFYHVIGARILDAAGIAGTHVPYKGGVPLLQDMMAGALDIAVLPVDGTIAKLVEAGRLKILGVTGVERSPRFPNTATLSESTSLRGFHDRMIWAGLMAPKDTPDATVRLLHKALGEALKAQEVRKALVDAGGQVPPSQTLEEAAAFYTTETSELQEWVKAAGLLPH